MKALAINGSPRKGGNTETLLRKVLEPLTKAGWDTGLIQLEGGMKFGVPGLLPGFRLLQKTVQRGQISKGVSH